MQGWEPLNIFLRLAFWLTRQFAGVMPTFSPVKCHFWAKLQRMHWKFRFPIYRASTGITLGRFERWYWSSNIGQLLAPKIGPILGRVFSSGNSHLGSGHWQRVLCILNLKMVLRFLYVQSSWSLSKYKLQSGRDVLSYRVVICKHSTLKKKTPLEAISAVAKTRSSASCKRTRIIVNNICLAEMKTNLSFTGWFYQN